MVIREWPVNIIHIHIITLEICDTFLASFFDMFVAMMESFIEEAIGFLFNLEVNVPGSEPTPEVSLVTGADGEAVNVGKLIAPNAKQQVANDRAPLAKGLERKEETKLSYSAPDESGEATSSRGNGAKSNKAQSGPSRNRPCPCGSGKKYKLCHGSNA